MIEVNPTTKHVAQDAVKLRGDEDLRGENESALRVGEGCLDQVKIHLPPSSSEEEALSLIRYPLGELIHPGRLFALGSTRGKTRRLDLSNPTLFHQPIEHLPNRPQLLAHVCFGTGTCFGKEKAKHHCLPACPA